MGAKHAPADPAAQPEAEPAERDKMSKLLQWKEIVKRSRMLLDWTQEECAEELVVSKRTIEQWEAGNRIPKMLTYRQVVSEFQEWGIEYEYTHMQISGVKKKKPTAQPPEPEETTTPAPNPDKEQMRKRIKKDSMNREPEEYEVELSVIGYYIDDAVKINDAEMLEERIQDLEEIIDRIERIKTKIKRSHNV